VSGYLGVPLSRADIGRFADGEVNIQILDNVRGKDVFIIQSTSPPVSDSYMELLLMVACLRRSSARRITVVMPYVGYARASLMQDSAVPISARAIADMLETVGVDRVVGVDLHAAQMQGFFKPHVPTDNLEAVRVGANYFADSIELHAPMVVAIRPNTVQRAKDFRDTLTSRGRKSGNDALANARLAMVIRPDVVTPLATEREGEGAEEDTAAGIELVGFPDQIDGDVVLVEDIIDTARTLCAAARAVRARGAQNIYVFSTHGVFSKGALERIEQSPISSVVVTNTVTRTDAPEPKIIRLSIAPLLAETIRRIHEKESLSDGVFRKD
jgi:ribose-phosphate pyrophosphokinase